MKKFSLAVTYVTCGIQPQGTQSGVMCKQGSHGGLSPELMSKHFFIGDSVPE
jgi:hypothetical protein